jgi:hypothetical protein
MQSYFAAVRELLECAYNRLTGADPATQRIRETVDTLIEEVAIAECQRSPLVIIPFPKARRG